MVNHLTVNVILAKNTVVTRVANSGIMTVFIILYKGSARFLIILMGDLNDQYTAN